MMLRSLSIASPLALLMILSGCSGDDTSNDNMTNNNAADAGTPADSGVEDDAGMAMDAGMLMDAGTSSVSRCGEGGLELPGPAFFPEGIERTAEGTFYVGSLIGGTIVQFETATATAANLVAPGTGAVGYTGLLFDADADLLWACGVDFVGSSTATLQGIAPGDGTIVVEHLLPGGGLCNDIALDTSNNLYVTDTAGHRILRLAADDRQTENSLATWTADPIFQADLDPEAFGTLNGIVVSDGNIYVIRVDNGRLYRIPIEADGSAGTITQLTLDGDTSSGDGMEIAEDGSLLIVRNAAGLLVRVTLDGDNGTVATEADGLDGPTTFALDGTTAWVAEGQFDDLQSNPTLASLPFCVRRVELD